MKKIALLILFLSLVTMGIAQTSSVEVRPSQLFNFGWKFQYGDPVDAYKPQFDDSQWRKLDLPHDFQIEQPWTKSGGGARGFKEMGTGWYRKEFTADPAWKGKRVLLDFEGIMYVGDVWVNGEKVASSDYGYLGFETDITKWLNYDTKNVVAVRANTGKKNGSRWYTGGGLYRDVHIVVKNPVAIERHGVYITTPVINDSQASVAVQVAIEGIQGRTANDMQIRVQLFSPDGQPVGESTLPALGKSKLYIRELAIPTIQVKQPQLWSCDTPYLYTAQVSLVKQDTLLDQVTETFGFRTLEFSPEFGFKLNGKKLFLKGMSNHHDMGILGAAAFDTGIERQFIQMKKFGYNHIRCSHNPYSEAFLRLADKHGILVVDELIDKWSDDSYWGGREPFSNLWYKLYPEWVKRDRNHPSVILWSLGNELQMQERLAGFPTGDWGVTTYKIFDVLVKRYDATRKTTVAMFPSRAGAIGRNDEGFATNFEAPELSLVTEIASYNYQYPAYAKYLQAHPNLIIYQSEATSNELLAPYFGMDREKMVGLAYWGALEYWGESGGWPKKGWNFSYFNHSLEPLPQAYLIQSGFEEEIPLVHIGVMDGKPENRIWNDVKVGHMPMVAHWNFEKGTTHNLFTFTNADEVELLVNGKSMGTKLNDRSTIKRRNMVYWENIPYGEGGKIVAIARNNGKEVARHQLETAGKAVALKMVAEQEQWAANGMDLQYVKVYAVDRKGRTVPTFDGEATFEVTGAATLFGVDNGDHTTDKIFNENNHIAFHQGFAMAVLRAGKEAGKVEIKASAPGLKKANKKWELTGNIK